MSITLSAPLEKRVREYVDSGAYGSPEQVVAAGLALLEDRERKLAELRADIDAADEEVARGDTAPLDIDALLERLHDEDEKGR